MVHGIECVGREGRELEPHTQESGSESEHEPSAGDIHIRERIVHTLRIFPKVSLSMLQVAIGTSLPPKMWHPVLDALLLEGVVEKKQQTWATPSGRNQVYTILSLARERRED